MAMNRKGEEGLWDEADGFYYDLLPLTRRELPENAGALHGGTAPLVRHHRVGGMAVPEEPSGDARKSATAFGACQNSWSTSIPRVLDILAWPDRSLIALLNENKLRRILTCMLDENEFLSPLRHPGPLPLSPGSPLRLSCPWQGVPGGLSPGGIRHRHVRGQLQLAGSHLDAGEYPDHQGPASISTSTTVTTSKSNAPRARATS